MSRIVYDERVSEFVQARIGECRNPHTCVGVERDGRIIAGGLFERFNGYNVFFHGASDGSKAWVSRPLMRALAHHAFITIGSPRLSTYVAASNTGAIAFDKFFDFEFEFSQKRAAHDGSDLIWFVMWKEKCKWLSL